MPLAQWFSTCSGFGGGGGRGVCPRAVARGPSIRKTQKATGEWARTPYPNLKSAVYSR
jgi:hypothetical protein